jgi:hypothetical protein
LNLNFLLVHRNGHLERMDDGQKTPHGHPDCNSYVKILGVFIFQMDRQTDGQTEKLIWCGLGNLIGSSRYMFSPYSGISSHSFGQLYKYTTICSICCILLWKIAHSLQFPFIGQIYRLDGVHQKVQLKVVFLT